MNSLDHLLRRIINAPFTCISVDSNFPVEIIAKIEDHKKQENHDIVVLKNADVWRYGNDRELLEYLGNESRKFYILHVGYENRKILDNVYEISWPLFYFQRPRWIYNDLLLKPRTYGFSCLNNRSSFHRLVLGQALWKNNLLNDMIYTQNMTNLPTGNYEFLMSEIDSMSNYLSALPISWQGEEQKVKIINYHSVLHPAYTDTWCNIVTESEMQEFIFEGPIIDLPTITEKSYKPFRSKQIPIWLAAPGHMKYLRSLGFETMDDILSSEYDNADLFAKVEVIVKTVAKGKEYVRDFYHDHLQEIQHNYDLVQSNKVDDKIIDNIKNFLMTL